MKISLLIKSLAPLVAVFLLNSCAGTDEPLVVYQYTMRDQTADSGGDPMIEHEKKRRLFGAVSMDDRRERLGQYYTVHWNLPEGSSGDREVIFLYQQGKSGSRVKTMKLKLPTEKNDGIQEFAIIGDDYFENGRVLAWKMSLNVGGETIATQQSYLWE
ncbi:hypothetical protein [Luteolibacter sp. AS25]|uniref:hypothetical protein n=1 Tax=Luteolibacter sp. AS25 TaxID=3135776 RepID=UPI00398B1F2A